MKSKLFGERMTDGIYSATKGYRDIKDIKRDIENLLGYSRRTVESMMSGMIPKDPRHIEKLLEYFQKESHVDRRWALRFLEHARYPDPDQLLNKYYPKDRREIFLCFDRSAQHDTELAMTLMQRLHPWCNVFQDQPRSGDANWMARVTPELERALEDAEFVIVLLSCNSVNSEVMRFELDKVVGLTVNHGLPKILLVRMAYLGPAFTETFGDKLDSEPWVGWFSPDDTSDVVEAISQAIKGDAALPLDGENLRQMRVERPDLLLSVQPSPSARVIPLESPEGGTVNPDSAFYVKRDTDDVALAAIQRNGTTLVIKGPRQVGKSSLLLRIATEAERLGKRVAYLDFQLLQSALAEANTFYSGFCGLLAEQLNVEPPMLEKWDANLTNSMKCTKYIEQYIFEEVDSSLVLAIDEADVVFGAAFQNDFFAMLRTWHNKRAFSPKKWKRLDLVVVISTEPRILIRNPNQSPFNVGEKIALQNFTMEQVMKLNELHDGPLTREQLEQLKILLGGQPFLTRLAFYLVATQRLPFVDLLQSSSDDDGPFGDHLRALWLLVTSDETLKQGLQQVLRDHIFSDELVFFRLRAAGLVQREGQDVVFSCQLYADFFSMHLNE